jgi:serine/threonine protein phosphatase PrpC
MPGGKPGLTGATVLISFRRSAATLMAMSSSWTALSATTRGNWHENVGQANQDAVRVQRGPFGSVILAVSDGHGGAPSFRSDRGSKLAVACGVRLIAQILRWSGRDVPLSRLHAQVQTRWTHGVVAEWRRAVRNDVGRHPFRQLDFAHLPERMPATPCDKEWPFDAYLAYGATLLMTAVTRNHVIYAQLGDGDILTVTDDGQVRRPLERHHDFYDAESASLCTHGAPREFQVAVHPLRIDRPAAIMLSSDGYANCFGHDEGFFKVGTDLLDYARARGRTFVAQHLGSWLQQSSRDGSGDDITVALALRRAALRPH